MKKIYQAGTRTLAIETDAKGNVWFRARQEPDADNGHCVSEVRVMLQPSDRLRIIAALATAGKD